MRVVMFGTRDAAALAADALRGEHDIVAIVVPRSRGWRAIARKPIDRIRHRVAVSRADLLSLREPLQRWRPDIICISGFPWILSEDLLTSAAHGAINAHPSLLPRHRGRSPLFWIYREDDRETGVTVHRAVARADAGEIILQSRFALPRGFPVRELADRKRRLAAELLRDALRGNLTGTPQDESAATYAPRVERNVRSVDFETWPTERVWHFLRGLCPFLIEPLGIDYRGVGDFELRPHFMQAGTTTRVSGGWLLYCRDGVVRLLA